MGECFYALDCGVRVVVVGQEDVPLGGDCVEQSAGRFGSDLGAGRAGVSGGILQAGA